MFRGQQQATPGRFQDVMSRQKVVEQPHPPYLRFVRRYWMKVRQDNPDAQLWDISREVRDMWRNSSATDLEEYLNQYEAERSEYEKNSKNPMMPNPTSNSKRNQKQSGGGNRRQDPNSGVVIQPVVDEDVVEANPRRIAAMRYDRNQRLMADLLNGQPMPDLRTFVSPVRISALRSQGDNLEVHRKRILNDMDSIKDKYHQKKRQIQEDAEHFELELKKACEMRPKVDEEMYAEMVAKAEADLVQRYNAYLKKQEALRLQQEAERKETPILYSLTVSPDDTDGKPGPSDSQCTPADSLVAAPSAALASAKSPAPAPTDPPAPAVDVAVSSDNVTVPEKQDLAMSAGDVTTAPIHEPMEVDAPAASMGAPVSSTDASAAVDHLAE